MTSLLHWVNQEKYNSETKDEFDTSHKSSVILAYIDW